MSETRARQESGDVSPALNAAMKLFLKTPLLQKAIGKQLALLSFTGRRSGKSYTIPVSYERDGKSILMLTRKTRSWWRNFADLPAVELRLAGEVVAGTAGAHVGTDHHVADVVAFLATRPLVELRPARFCLHNSRLLRYSERYQWRHGRLD